jgi:hypothetical protein
MMPKVSPGHTILSNRLRHELQYTMRRISRTYGWSQTVATPRTFTTTSFLPQHASATGPEPYWTHVKPWQEVQAADFLSYGWQVR